MITRYAWGEIWTRPGLPRNTRSLLTVSYTHLDVYKRQVLQLRGALDLMDQALLKLCDAIERICETHKSTLMVGRTWLQQGPPVTLGLKAAGWLAAVERHRERLGEIRKRALVLQFGGAVGTLAALGDRGPAVAAALAEELKLALPSLPWHAHRDRFAEVATTMGLLCLLYTSRCV